MKHFWEGSNWTVFFDYFSLLGATASSDITTVDTESFDLMTIDMYFGSGDSTAVKTVPTTSLTATFLDENYYAGGAGLSADCCEADRSSWGIFNGNSALDSERFSIKLSYPEDLRISGYYSNKSDYFDGSYLNCFGCSTSNVNHFTSKEYYNAKMCFDSTWSNNYSDYMSIGLIDTYSGSSYDSGATPTWDGADYVKAWMGLGFDSTDEQENIFWSMYSEGTISSMEF